MLAVFDGHPSSSSPEAGGGTDLTTEGCSGVALLLAVVSTLATRGGLHPCCLGGQRWSIVGCGRLAVRRDRGQRLLNRGGYRVGRGRAAAQTQQATEATEQPAWRGQAAEAQALQGVVQQTPTTLPNSWPKAGKSNCATWATPFAMT